MGGFPPLYTLHLCILALHLQDSGLFLGHLSHQSSTECDKRGCLAVKLLFRCHFLFNAIDKVVAVYSMRRGKVYLYRKLPPTALASFHSTFTTKRVLIQHYLLSPSLLRLMKSFGRICFHRWNHVCYLIFNPPQSSDNLQHVSSFNQHVYPTPNMVVVPLCFKKIVSS